MISGFIYGSSKWVFNRSALIYTVEVVNIASLSPHATSRKIDPKCFLTHIQLSLYAIMLQF